MLHCVILKKTSLELDVTHPNINFGHLLGYPNITLGTRFVF